MDLPTDLGTPPSFLGSNRMLLAMRVSQSRSAAPHHSYLAYLALAKNVTLRVTVPCTEFFLASSV